ncbi:MAG: nucleotide sugar dehydrogenase [Planctomycetes bacterium]|jgi:GDP-mannose 6-dehydrogenase|nr:nucleotide sugar dehydrogenase [Planctomycetota bacterium]
MRVSIFGLGYVGAVTAGCLVRNGHTVVGVDPDQRKLEFIRQGKAPILEEGVEDLMKEAAESGRLTVTTDCAEAIAATDISLVCVGTPSAPDGSLGTIYVKKVCEEIGDALKNKDSYHTVVVRSTVAPGTTMGILKPILEQRSGGEACEKFGLAMNPEFLREGTSIKDFYDPPYTVVGTDNDEVFTQVCELYKETGGENVRCSIPAAESIKYACNLFHATKITFANEIGMVCKAAGVDSREVMRIVCEDTKLNISDKYMKPGFAFGGSCLPKDLRAFAYVGRSNNTPVSMFESMLKSNREQIERAAARIMALGSRKIAMMGVSFKEGTDDLRESPLIGLAEILIGKGYDLVIYDPNVEYAALFGSNKRYIEEHLPHLKRALVSAEVALKHGETIVFGHKHAAYQPILGQLRNDQKVFDLVGMCGPEDVPGDYEGLYW